MTLEQEQTVSFSIIKAEPYAFLAFLLQMVISQFLIFLYALSWNLQREEKHWEAQLCEWVILSLVPRVPTGKHAKQDELLSELEFNFEEICRERLCCRIKKLIL